MTQPSEPAQPPAPDAERTDAATRDRWRVVRPLGHRDFRVLFGAVVLSIFAAGMWAVVMVYAVIDAGGGPLGLSLVAGANATGLLLCAIPGGIVADRVSRRTIVRVVELANFVAITSIVVAGLVGSVTIPHLTIVAFVLGGFMLFDRSESGLRVPWTVLLPSALLMSCGEIVQAWAGELGCVAMRAV